MFIAKAKAFLLHLYPELSRFSIFHQVPDLSTVLTPTTRKIMRYGLPFVTISLVALIGLGIGTFFLSFFSSSDAVPNPIVIVTPAPTNTYKSTFIPLGRSVQDFNPQLPDPIPPVFDEKISLEPLPQ